MQQAIADARRSRRLVALLFMDLDHFKQVNDTLGHGAGDVLLCEVADAAQPGRARHRSADPGRPRTRTSRSWRATAATSSSSASRGITSAADAARVAGADPGRARGADPAQRPRGVHCTASIGISLYPQDGDDPETLLKHADAAMYQAKASGRNNYHFYDPSLSFRAFQRLSMETSLRRALEREEFVLHWQPIVDVADRRRTAAEGLVRWLHPEMGLVHPDEFIPLAEETGPGGSDRRVGPQARRAAGSRRGSPPATTSGWR